MTGYGQGVSTEGGATITVEIRSVNRRQAEFNLRLPRELERLEHPVRERLAQQISRGRIDLTLTCANNSAEPTAHINRAAAAACANELRSVAAALGLSQDITLETLLRFPGVIEPSTPNPEPDAWWQKIQPAVDAALANLNAMRDREGAHLASELASRIDSMRQAVHRMQRIAPEVAQRHQNSLLQKIRAAGIESIDPNDERLLKEIVIFADRSDICEELTRLQSHFVQFDDCLTSRDPVGRKLDFLAQELNREINTIGSKANDAAIAADVVLVKTEIERFREQAQNIE